MTDVHAAKEQIHSRGKKMTLTKKPSVTDENVTFTDSDCEGILEEIDTPRTNSRKEKSNVNVDNHHPSIKSNLGSRGKKPHKIERVSVFTKESQECARTPGLMPLNHNANGNRSAFSPATPKAAGLSQTGISATTRVDVTVQEQTVNGNNSKDDKPKKEPPDSDVTTTSRNLPRLTCNGKPEVLRQGGRSSSDDVIINGDKSNTDIENIVDNNTGPTENNTTGEIPQVKLNLHRLDVRDASDEFRRHRRSSTGSSTSSMKDQSSQTVVRGHSEFAIHQMPVSPRVSPLTSARYSPRRVSSAELHRTPEQMVKQADRLIERTQVIMQRSAEAKRRTENLLKASRERRAQERFEELSSLERPHKTNSEASPPESDSNGNHLGDT